MNRAGLHSNAEGKKRPKRVNLVSNTMGATVLGVRTVLFSLMGSWEKAVEMLELLGLHWGFRPEREKGMLPWTVNQASSASMSPKGISLLGDEKVQACQQSYKGGRGEAVACTARTYFGCGESLDHCPESHHNLIYLIMQYWRAPLFFLI